MHRKNFTRRLAGGTAIAAALLAAGLAQAQAQTYPDKPIRFVVPWPAGGATDQVARILSVPLSQALGVPVIVDNKAGAGGNIGTLAVARERPDGYTILLATSSTNAAGPYLYARQGFDPAKDFTAVVQLCSIPNIMVVPAKSPWRSLKDVVDAAKKEPGKFTYGSAGIGGSQHLAGAQFKTSAAIDIRHVPYKGSGPAAQDLMAGHIDMMLDTGSLGSIRGGVLRPLAVAADKRLPVLPDVPTFAEAGTPMLASAWYGVMLPAGAPAEVVARLNKEINTLLLKPEIRTKLQDMGAEVAGGSAETFSKFSLAEIKRYEGIVRTSGAPQE
ncbi:bugT protein [Rhodoferax koreense]|uniref:BugT protein n=1 Tax=Rhodoferax koreensis TaxID=1842727 RepID=A0A1P8JY46_9BURK|nr:tripartite tricarboxylate transporter substrate binding protein [Rhodoferax koreense]APW38683.1 bugT protein [Rhodoferax koreense]